MEINKLIQVIERFREVSPDIQALTILTFLYVGRRGVCVQKDIEYELRVSNAAASRNINYWSNTGTKGLDFMERYEDPTDRRNNLLRLSKKGLAFYNEVLGRK